MGGAADAAAGSSALRAGESLEEQTPNVEDRITGGDFPNVTGEISSTGQFQSHETMPDNTPEPVSLPGVPARDNRGAGAPTGKDGDGGL